jgi:hypothetical protein
VFASDRFLRSSALISFLNCPRNLSFFLFASLCAFSSDLLASLRLASSARSSSRRAWSRARCSCFMRLSSSFSTSLRSFSTWAIFFASSFSSACSGVPATTT